MRRRLLSTALARGAARAPLALRTGDRLHGFVVRDVEVLCPQRLLEIKRPEIVKNFVVVATSAEYPQYT